MTRPALIALLTLAAPVAQAQGVLHTDAGSTAMIIGSTNARGFVCHADSVWGAGNPDRESGRLEVPVGTIDCGNRHMSRDLRETLQADAFPSIRFDLGRVERVSSDSVVVSGMLTIAGISRDVRVAGAVTSQSDGRWRLEGTKRLRLTDFGIDPPTKFLGLVRVHNEIDVRFDLFASRRNPAHPAGNS